MALNCFQNSAEPIKVYKILLGAFVGNVGKTWAIIGFINRAISDKGEHRESELRVDCSTICSPGNPG